MYGGIFGGIYLGYCFGIFYRGSGGSSKKQEDCEMGKSIDRISVYPDLCGVGRIVCIDFPAK